MTQQIINVGAYPNDANSDPARNSFQKVNANFTELYAASTPGGTNGQVQYNNAGTFGGSGMTYSLATGGVNIAAPTSGYPLTVNSAAGASEGLLVNGAVGTNPYIALSINGARSGFIQAASGLVIGIDGSNSLTVATNSINRIAVGGAGNVTIAAPTSGTALGVKGEIDITAASAAKLGWDNAGNYFNWIECGGTPAANYMRFATANAERMRIDQAGNVGLGTTTSTWTSYTAFQLPAGALAGIYGSNRLDLVQNGYYNGAGYLYTGSFASSLYRQTDGAHSWYTAAAGTAGAALTFSATMSIAATGAVTIAAPTSGNTLILNNTTGNYWLQGTDATSSFAGYSSGAAGVFMGVQTNHALTFFTNAFTNPRMIIAATGNVTINAPTSGNGLTVSNTALTTAAIVATSSTSPTGIGLYNTFADSANRNWAVLTSQNAYGDFVIRQSTAQNGNPIPAGTDRFSIGPLGNVTINAPSSGVSLTVNTAGSNVVVATIGGMSVSNGAVFAGSTTEIVSSPALNIGTNAAVAVGLWTNSAQRLSISSVGAATLSAPTAGVALTVTPLAGQNAIVTTGAIKMASFTVAGLPAAATVGAGARAFVTDALTPVFQATVVAGGAVLTPVYSDGTNWKVG